MADIQYDPECVDCRRDNGRDLASTTWQCNRHVLAERNWLRAKLANVMVEWEHDVEVLTKERNAALTLAEQRGAAYDMTWREVESLREWKDKLERERDNDRDRAATMSLMLDTIEGVATGQPGEIPTAVEDGWSTALAAVLALSRPAPVLSTEVREAAERLRVIREAWSVGDTDAKEMAKCADRLLRALDAAPAPEPSTHALLRCEQPSGAAEGEK